MTDRIAYRAPVGTRDVLPPDSARWEALLGAFTGVVEPAGYGLLQSPTFEDVGVFQRLGEGTDVVRKEMYDFDDKGGRHVALRPEGTASVARAFAQHRPVTPWKVWYATPCFRYERPQAGRLRQHHQLGIEVLGPLDADLDVEVIALGWDYLRSLGLRRVALVVNSMGTADDRRSYVELVAAWLRERSAELHDDDRAKLDQHPLRVLDSKHPETRAVVADAPRITDHLSAEGRAHFERVQEGLRALSIPFRVEPSLVRGLDYYTHTTFELVSDALDAAQSTVLGGGRYDGLVAQLGGPPTPGMGFGSGIERVLLACDAEDVFTAPAMHAEVFVVDLTGGAEARDLAVALRRAGLRTERAYENRSMRAQMKVADRSGAGIAVLIGERERAAGTVTLRRLRRSDDTDEATQRTVPRKGLLDALADELGRPLTTPRDPS